MPAPYRYAVRSFHGPAKLETGLTDLSSEGWEPLNFHRDAAGTCNVVLRRNQDGNGATVSYRYGTRNIHGAAKLESELTNLSDEGWEPVDFQRDEAGTYNLILRCVHDEQTGATHERSEAPINVAPHYRYAVRHVHGAANLESELTSLSGEGWEPLSFVRDAAGTYEVILRVKIGSRAQ